MKRMNNRSGFTLLEIIIVIIIIGVLASLALPRMFAMTDNAKAVEAMNYFKTIRSGMEMCGMMNSEDYTNCTTWPVLGMNDPNAEAGKHFTYTAPVPNTVEGYSITATQWKNGAAVAGNTLVYTYDKTATPPVTIVGAGAFASINMNSDT